MSSWPGGLAHGAARRAQAHPTWATHPLTSSSDATASSPASAMACRPLASRLLRNSNALNTEPARPSAEPICGTNKAPRLGSWEAWEVPVAHPRLILAQDGQGCLKQLLLCTEEAGAHGSVSENATQLSRAGALHNCQHRKQAGAKVACVLCRWHASKGRVCLATLGQSVKLASTDRWHGAAFLWL